MPGHPVVPMSPVPGPSHAIPASGSVPPSPSLYATPGHSNSMREKGHRRQPSAIKQKIADMAMVLAADTSSLLTLAPSLRSSFGRSLGGDLDFLAALGAPLSAVVDNETPGEASEVPPVINSPRKPVIMALGDYRDEDEDDGMCGVCLDDSGGGLIQLMPCHHLLCVECAEELVMLHTKDPCPCPFCRSLICNFASVATAARNMN